MLEYLASSGLSPLRDDKLYHLTEFPRFQMSHWGPVYLPRLQEVSNCIVVLQPSSVSVRTMYRSYIYSVPNMAILSCAITNLQICPLMSDGSEGQLVLHPSGHIECQIVKRYPEADLRTYLLV